MKIIIFLLMFLPVSSFAQSEFCKGFEEGYKAVKGNYALTPICPLEPLISFSSNALREGIKKGIVKAIEKE